jgi:hypothetical protein
MSSLVEGESMVTRLDPGVGNALFILPTLVSTDSGSFQAKD